MLFSLIFTLIGPIHAEITIDKEMDRQSILKQAGCYEVTFQNAETFARVAPYAYHDRHKSKGLELILPIKTEENEISLQHLLLVKVNQQVFAQKHWRQVWKFNPESVYEFLGDNAWTKKTLTSEARVGNWSQEVTIIF